MNEYIRNINKAFKLNFKAFHAARAKHACFESIIYGTLNIRMRKSPGY
jgi:hypothetical protein